MRFNFLDYLRHALHVPRVNEKQRRRAEQMEHDAQPENYPPHLAHLAPTEADLDMIAEEMSGKPVDKGLAGLNLAAIENRIEQLEQERDKLKSNELSMSAESFNTALASYEADLTTARDLLTRYRASVAKTN